jgi:hypothetical protein
MQITKSLLAAVSTYAIASAAHATLQVSFKPVPISAGAMADDPQLKETADYHPLARTFEMDITQSGGEKWTFATIKTTLPEGSFYVPTTGNMPVAQDGIWSNGGSRHLQYDTFVTTPHGGGSNTLILGKSDYPVNQTGPAIMPGANSPAYVPGNANAATINDPMTIDISWGDMYAAANPKPDGTYAIARVTLMGMSSASMIGHYGGTQHNFSAVMYGMDIPLPTPFDFNNDGYADSGDVSDAVQVMQGNVSEYFDNHPELADESHVNYLNYVGDLNGDGEVNRNDIRDYLYVLDSVGAQPYEEAPLVALLPTPLSGDASGDGTVNSVDFGILSTHFGQTTGQSFSTGDFNGDGATNALDFNAIAQHYGEAATSPALAASIVPEPAGLGLLAATITMLRRRHLS